MNCLNLIKLSVVDIIIYENIITINVCFLNLNRKLIEAHHFLIDIILYIFISFWKAGRHEILLQKIL